MTEKIKDLPFCITKGESIDYKSLLKFKTSEMSSLQSSMVIIESSPKPISRLFSFRNILDTK
jgi:hypothetical protein